MKFCPECGTAVSGGKFCSECGYRLQGDVTPRESAGAAPQMGLGLDLPDLSSFDALGSMANNCVEQDQARQEAEALAAFEVEKHQNGKYAILALKDKSEMDVVVPSGVEAIGPGAFEGSDVLTVVLPEGLRKIGDRAFADCEDLESINFPKSLRVIGDEAFSGCANLDAEAPDGVRIGENAFLGTYPDLRRSDIIQSAMDKIAGLMAEAEALFDDDDEVEFDDYSEALPIGEPLDVVLIDESENNGVEVTFRGFEVNELLPGKFVHLMVVEVWNPSGKEYSMGVNGLRVKGGETGSGWAWPTASRSERHTINMHMVVKGFDPEGKYEISGNLYCRVSGGSYKNARFKATVDFDEELQACDLVE